MGGLPVVVGFAEELVVPDVARAGERGGADAARETGFVPRRLAHPDAHQEAVLDLLPAALAHLPAFLAFDRL